MSTAAVFIIMHEGVILTVKVDRAFGFIGAPGQPDAWFHRDELADLDWNEQLTGRRVRFDILATPKGPRAKNIRAAE
jgi:cold shock CspA family protein